MANPPNSVLVAAAWLRTFGLPAGSSRPADVSTWSASGFLVVSVVGSAGTLDLSEQRKPVISVDSWGVAPTSSKPPKAQTAGNLEIVRRHVEAFQPITVNPGTGYASALVQDAWMVAQEPREVPDPDASYAHYVQEIGLAWVSLG